MRDELVPKLDGYLAAFFSSPVMVWGKSDCGYFTGGWLVLAAGIDVVSTLPKWTSEDEAAAMMQARGWDKPGDCLRGVLTEQHPSRAMLGDLVEHRGSATLGICIGVDAVFADEKTIGGKRLLPMRHCSRSWSLGV